MIKKSSVSSVVGVGGGSTTAAAAGSDPSQSNYTRPSSTQMKSPRKTNIEPTKKVTTLNALKERYLGREDGSHQRATQNNNVILHLRRRNSQSVQRLAFSRSCGSSGGVFTSMGPQSQAGEESNFVGGGKSGSDPSVSNIQEEASTAHLGEEESDITSTQIVTSTAVEVELESLSNIADALGGDAVIDEAIESNDTSDFSNGSSGSGVIVPRGILLAAPRICNTSRKVTWDPRAFASMGPQSQAGEESNFVGGDGSGSDPSVSNIQEASTAQLGEEESDITSTQIVVTSTAVEVELESTTKSSHDREVPSIGPPQIASMKSTESECAVDHYSISPNTGLRSQVPSSVLKDFARIGSDKLISSSTTFKLYLFLLAKWLDATNCLHDFCSSKSPYDLLISTFSAEHIMRFMGRSLLDDDDFLHRLVNEFTEAAVKVGYYPSSSREFLFSLFEVEDSSETSTALPLSGEAHSVLSRTHRLSYAYDPMRSTRPPSLVLQLLHPYHVTITCILDYYYQCYSLSLHPITRPHTNVACYFKRFIRQLSPHRCSYEGGLATGR